MTPSLYWRQRVRSDQPWRGHDSAVTPPPDRPAMVSSDTSVAHECRGAIGGHRRQAGLTDQLPEHDRPHG